MLPKSELFAFFVICGAISWTNAQMCIPNPVDDIDLSLDSQLTWAASENCPETTYNIRISLSGVVQYEYTVDGLSFDLSFLTFCRTYTVTVTPVANHILGMESNFQASITLPQDVDVTVQNFTGVQIEHAALFQWLVDERYRYCVRHYHIYLWNEDSSDPLNLYVLGSSGYLLEGVPQCMNYRLDISAYFLEKYGTATTFNYTVPQTTNTPVLQYVRQDALTINTTWALEKYSTNRCKVTALHVNSNHFNTTVAIEDTPERPNVDVSISGLRANSMYYFNVTVENEAGLSNAFKMAVQTLPIDPTKKK